MSYPDASLNERGSSSTTCRRLSYLYYNRKLRSCMHDKICPDSPSRTAIPHVDCSDTRHKHSESLPRLRDRKSTSSLGVLAVYTVDTPLDPHNNKTLLSNCLFLRTTAPTSYLSLPACLHAWAPRVRLSLVTFKSFSIALLHFLALQQMLYSTATR